MKFVTKPTSDATPTVRIIVKAKPPIEGDPLPRYVYRITPHSVETTSVPSAAMLFSDKARHTLLILKHVTHLTGHACTWEYSDERALDDATALAKFKAFYGKQAERKSGDV